MNKLTTLTIVSLLALSGCAEVIVDQETGTSTTPGTSTEQVVEVKNETPAPATEVTTRPAVEEMKVEQVSVPEALVINMESGNMFFKPNTINAKVNQQITINFANDGFHTFVLDALGVSVDLKNKPSASVTFTPTKAGTFEFICDVGSHAAQGMKGTLIVE